MDKITAIRNKGALVMIAGRPGMGKTSFALDVAKQMALNKNENIVMISLEMLKEQIIARLQRKTGGHTEYNNIFIFDNSKLSVKDIEALCQKTENLGAVIIDCFQLIQPLEESVSRELKCMALRLKVPVICTSQVSPACEEREDKRPTLRDLHRGIDIDADQIFFVYRDRYYNPETPVGDRAECMIKRNKHGTCRTVNLMWDPQRLQFSAADE